MKFTHLHTHSHYSLLDGLAKIDDLVNHAKALGMQALALTDHGNLYGAIEFYKKAKAVGIKPIMGIEAYVAPKDHRDKNPGNDEKYFHLILLAKNQVGWRNLIELTTKAHLDGFYYKPRIDKNLLRQYGEGLIALSGCLSGEVSRLLLNNRYESAKKAALEYLDIFGAGNFFIEIGHHPGIKDTLKIRDGLIRVSRETGIPLAATQDIHYLKSEDAEYHDILLAVQTGNKLNDPDRLSLREDDFSMRSPEQMAELFQELPEAVANTVKISEMCNVEIELGKIHLPRFPLPVGKTSAKEYLRELINERLPGRFASATQEIEKRLEYELGVIEKMDFPDYFLIVQDFINWAKERGIIVGPGRGSAAGSLVSYVLGITDVDPLAYDLLFERFLNPDRVQFPDIDVDITDQRRGEVFAYIEEKYGRDRVAHIITFGTMAARAAARDVGRALGVSYGFCDQLAKLIPFNQNLTTAIENVGELKTLYENNADAKKILDAARHLEGVARHASVHACGIVITAEPLTEYLPLQRAPQDENVIVSQFEMHSVEDLGLLKMDILGLKNLTIIENTIRLVDECKNEKIDLSKLPPKDEKTFKLLRATDTTGVFQLESSGMRRYLKELKPTEIEDIIAMISLYRPGPMELIPDYIDRKHGRQPVTYLHPKLEPVLKKTYGIMIYQEQLMQAARVLANFTLAEADVLRKAVGKKIRKLLLEQKDKLIKGCLANDIPQHIAEKFWTLIEPFDRYGFNRCLTSDTELTHPKTGAMITLAELYKNKNLMRGISSLGNSMKIENHLISEVFYNGRKSVWKITTRSGRTIKATGNHPFLMPDGWRKLEEIKVGDKVAVPRIIPEPLVPKRVEKHKLGLLGYLLAEGNFCHPNSFYFYSTNEKEINDYLQYLNTFINTQGKIDRSKSAIAVYAKRKNINLSATAVTWIDSLGLKYKKATEKFFPEFVFRLSNNNLSLLIAKMFQGDGCINLKRKDPQIFYATSSEKLAYGLQHLFLRFGILSSIHKKHFKYRGGAKPGYTININRYDNIKKFIDAFGKYFVGEKKRAVKKIQTDHPILNGSLSPWAARGSYDIIPTALILPRMRAVVQSAGLSFADFSRQGGVSERLFLHNKKKIGYLRETVAVIADGLRDKELSRYADSDIYWDGVKNIEFAGIEDTYDITVDKTHNFIANNFFVHNSHAAAYAAIAYQTAYLKSHYPVEFMASLLNADSGDTDRVSFLISECAKMNIKVLPPDINKSSSHFTPENNNIRFGLIAIKNVGENIVRAIIEKRQRGGEFENLYALINRVQHKDLNKKSLESLIKSGALDAFGFERNQALQNIDDILRYGQLLKKEKQSSQIGLFGTAALAPKNLKLKPAIPASPAEKLAWEKALLGLYISDHPLNPYKTKLEQAGARPIKVALVKNGYQTIGGVVASIRRIVTKTGKPMLFAKIEDFNDRMEVVVFPETLERTAAIWTEGRPVLLTGKVSLRNGENSLICDKAILL